MLPIEYDSRGHGFFFSRPVGRFPLITVSEGEVVALLVAQKAAEQITVGPRLKNRCNPPFRSLSRVLPARRVSLLP